MHVIIRGIMLQ